METHQISIKLKTSIYQRLPNPELDKFILETILWQRLSLEIKEIVECSQGWYFERINIFQGWRVPALIIQFQHNNLFAQERHYDQLIYLADELQHLTLIDRIRVNGADICIHVWYDYTTRGWHKQPLQLPPDWLEAL